MRYFEFMPEGSKPTLTQAIIDRRKQADARYKAEQKAKQPLFAHMYAVDKPHDLFMQAVERYKADMELKQLRAELIVSSTDAAKAEFDPVRKMARKQRMRNIGV